MELVVILGEGGHLAGCVYYSVKLYIDLKFRWQCGAKEEEGGWGSGKIQGTICELEVVKSQR